MSATRIGPSCRLCPMLESSGVAFAVSPADRSRSWLRGITGWSLLPLFFLAAVPACDFLDTLRGEQKTGPTVAPGDPVAQAKLAAILPKLEGWEGPAPAGKRVPAGEHEVTSAKASYSKQVDGQTLTVNLELMDGNHIPSVYSHLAVWAHKNPSTDFHKNSIEIEGHSGFEKWDPESKRVTVVFLVKGRFLFTFKGKNLSPEVVEKWLHAVEWKRLAGFT